MQWYSKYTEERRTEKVAFLGMMITLACLISYVEACLPLTVGIPGIKLGLANLVILFVLNSAGPRPALTVSFLRILVVTFLFGNLNMAIYSCAGAAASLAVMWFLKHFLQFSVLGISVAGGIMHNVGQLTAAALLLRNQGVFGYFPVLLASGVATGLVVGLLEREIEKRLPQKF
ncbi:MAG: Gx transporter family protein [Lachnospiraceae bacterium]|nr:Gx transporter family protein [Lachnospiraceae bacterium]